MLDCLTRLVRFCNQGKIINHTNSLSVWPDMMKIVTVKVPEAWLRGIDALVRDGMYQNRSAAVRAAIRDLLKREVWKDELA